MFIEYPKSLYMGGDINSDHVIVQDANEEAAKRGEGFRMAWEQDAPAGLTIEEVRAKLDAAGIPYDKRLGLEKLKALLPKE